MKKLLILILTLFLSICFMYPQSIQVITPKTGVTWYIGDTVKITWKSVNLKDNLVKINIFRDKIEQANFVHQLTSPEILTELKKN